MKDAVIAQSQSMFDKAMVFLRASTCKLLSSRDQLPINLASRTIYVWYNAIQQQWCYHYRVLPGMVIDGHFDKLLDRQVIRALQQIQPQSDLPVDITVNLGAAVIDRMSAAYLQLSMGDQSALLEYIERTWPFKESMRSAEQTLTIVQALLQADPLPDQRYAVAAEEFRLKTFPALLAKYTTHQDEKTPFKCHRMVQYMLASLAYIHGYQGEDLPIASDSLLCARGLSSLLLYRHIGLQFPNTNLSLLSKYYQHDTKALTVSEILTIIALLNSLSSNEIGTDEPDLLFQQLNASAGHAVLNAIHTHRRLLILHLGSCLQEMDMHETVAYKNHLFAELPPLYEVLVTLDSSSRALVIALLGSSIGKFIQDATQLLRVLHLLKQDLPVAEVLLKNLSSAAWVEHIFYSREACKQVLEEAPEPFRQKLAHSMFADANQNLGSVRDHCMYLLQELPRFKPLLRNTLMSAANLDKSSAGFDIDELLTHLNTDDDSGFDWQKSLR